jgi:pteridine reductase
MGFLKKRTALITGGARRIGSAITEALAKEGANVIIHYNTSSSEAEDLAKEVQKYGINAWPLQTNLNNQIEVGNLVDKVFSRYGQLDILINNASVFPKDTINDVNEKKFFDILQINAFVPFVMSKKFADHFIKLDPESDPVIINLLDSKIAGHNPEHFSYATSKKLLHSMTRVMALEFGPKVRVNAVAPGLILPPVGKDRSYLEKFKNENPLNAIGNVEDISSTVLFLIKSKFITGQVIFVDGGWHLKGNG